MICTCTHTQRQHSDPDTHQASPCLVEGCPCQVFEGREEFDGRAGLRWEELDREEATS